jgi:Leucine-rich repeat (LRR) protein
MAPSQKLPSNPSPRQLRNQAKDLALNGTQVSDAGLEHLKELTSLRRLDLRFTQVTDVGVNELKKALLNCRIYR